MLDWVSIGYGNAISEGELAGLRDDRADLAYFQGLRAQLQEALALGRADVADASRVARPSTHARDAQRYFLSALSMVKCAYGMGEPVAVISEHADELVRARASYLKAQLGLENGPHKFDEDRAEYVMPLQVLAIGRLTDRPDDTIHELVELNDNLGVDGIYDFLVRGSNSDIIDSVLYPKPYQQLLSVITATPDERPSLMAGFLKVWYNQSRGQNWWGRHKRIGDGSYVYDGYWCFEAAAVTKLLDIDDSSYRDNEYYPRDLV